MKIGDKVKIKTEFHPNGIDKYVHYKKIATVQKIERFLIKVSLDDFPNVNHRNYHNQFWYEKEELELINPEQ